jgi:hypothetical protein
VVGQSFLTVWVVLAWSAIGVSGLSSSSHVDADVAGVLSLFRGRIDRRLLHAPQCERSAGAGADSGDDFCIVMICIFFFPNARILLLATPTAVNFGDNASPCN